MGHPLIMGRKTFESIGKPLDGRDSIVISAKPLPAGREGIYFAPSLDAALAIAQERAKARGVTEIS